MDNEPNESIVPRADRRYPSLKEHDGPYNVAREEVPGWSGEFWNTSEDLPPLSEEEFLGVVARVRDVVSSFGTINPAPAPYYEEIDFFVVEEGCFDRTVKIEVVNFVRFWEVVVPLTNSLSESLGATPLWRIMFEADNVDAFEDAIVVYPECIRVDYEEKSHSIGGRLIQVAENRLRAWSQRERHRRERRSDLAFAIREAFEQMETSQDPVVLVAVFDTLSDPLSDMRNEGHVGRSIWLLFRDERDYHDLHFITEPPDEVGNPYFATPSGRLLNALPDDEVPADAKMLLDFQPPGDMITLCQSGQKRTFGWPADKRNSRNETKYG